jgi:hypothetical protein
MSDMELATTEDENVFVAVFPEMIDAFKQQFTKKKGWFLLARLKLYKPKLISCLPQ